ncbi:hypothetical protein [Streptomyces sp. NPDC000229]|uniref:hypothetical protein n=1 Tax=Streptomyces sp. NPDC000229 TaxID=3154247 RepID=UPI00332543FE
MRPFRTTDATLEPVATSTAPRGGRPLTRAENTELGSLGHEDHPDVGSLVRDIASGAEGMLTAVVRDKVATPPHGHRFVRLAYIKGDNDIEWSTDPRNITLIR